MVDAVGSTGSSSGLSGIENFQRNLFSKLDTDANSRVSQAEFIIGRSDNVSGQQAKEDFAALDIENTGSLSFTQFAPSHDNPPASITSLSDEALELLQQSQNSRNEHTPALTELFAKVDANNDGFINREEFIANRPDFISEQDANSVFSAIDGDQDGLLAKQEVEQFAKAQINQIANQIAAELAAHQPPPPPPAKDAEEEDDEHDALDTNKDGIVSTDELFSGTGAGATTDRANQLLFAQATQSYHANSFASASASALQNNSFLA